MLSSLTKFGIKSTKILPKVALLRSITGLKIKLCSSFDIMTSELLRFNVVEKWVSILLFLGGEKFLKMAKNVKTFSKHVLCSQDKHRKKIVNSPVHVQKRCVKCYGLFFSLLEIIA